MKRESLQKDYYTLREIKIRQIGQGMLGKGLGQTYAALKLNDAEILEILYAWAVSGKTLELKLYSSALREGDIEKLKTIDIIYQDIIKTERKVAKNNSR